jgi:hypothetical protein
MSDIVVNQGTGIPDPKLHAIAERVLALFFLAGEKAVAHLADPAAYPLPADPRSIEHVLLKRFQFLPPARQQKGLAKVMASVRAPAQSRAVHYGDLAQVNLRSPQPVVEQALALGLPPSLKFPLSQLQPPPAEAPMTVCSGSLPELPDRLWLRVLKVECLNETDGFQGSEAGEDEIYLGGTAIDAFGDAQPIGPARVGDFDGGDVKDYPVPWKIAEFDLAKGGREGWWNRTYLGTLVLFEHDNGNLSELENQIYTKARELAQQYVREAVAVGMSELGPVLGQLAGELAAWIVGQLFDWFRAMWEDEVFKPITVQCKILLPDSRFEGNKNHCPPLPLTWDGYGGVYRLWCDVRIQWSDESLSLRRSLGDKFDLSKGIHGLTPPPEPNGLRELIESIDD